MALNMAAFVRTSVVLMVAVVFFAGTQMEGQGVVAARFSEAIAPAPAELQDGLAPGALLPSLAGPVLMTMLSFFALKHL